MIKAYKLALSAEKLCLTIYKTSASNDASDACRHFIWSALLYRELGPTLSQKILNAHENNPTQPAKEKNMDLFNNKWGLITAKKLLKENKFSKKTILKSFQENLKQGKVIVLKKIGKNKKPKDKR